mgnify:CR=1 FL=1
MFANNKMFFDNVFDKYSIIITIIFCVSVTFVSISYSPFLNSENALFYYFPGTEILQGNVKDVVIPNATYFNAALFALTSQPFIHMKIVSILSGTGIVFLTYLITRQIFNSKIAILSTVFISIYAGLHLHSYLVEADIFPIFLLFVSFYFITKSNLNQKNIILVSIFLGLSFMLKYQAGIIGIGFLIFLFLYTKPRLKNSFLFLAVSLLVISPLLIFNYTYTEEIFTSNSSYLILMEWKNVPSEWYEDDSYNDSFLLFKNPELFLNNFGNNLYHTGVDTIFNLKWSFNNLSIFPLIPILGLIPLFGGMYFVRTSIPKNFIPLIIVFSIYVPIMCIFASVTNPIRLFPPALILIIFCAIFFSKINKKYLLIAILVCIIFMNLMASEIMANWVLYGNDSYRFWENEEYYKIEEYNIGIMLSEEENIEEKYVMAQSNIIPYYANSKFIRDYVTSTKNDTIDITKKPLGELEQHIKRENWKEYDIYSSDFYSHPQKENDLERIPDYFVSEPQENIPENWILIYESEKFEVYKIPKI